MESSKFITKFSEVRCEIERGTTGACYITPNGNRITVRRQGRDKYDRYVFHLYMNQSDMEKISKTKASIRGGRIFTDKTLNVKYLSFTGFGVSEFIEHLFEVCGIDSGLE